jgi:diguanylate cyclase (GGDEF)-like protein
MGGEFSTGGNKIVRDVVAASAIVGGLWIATFFAAALLEYAPHASLWFPPAAVTDAAFVVFGWRALPGIFVACVAGTVVASVEYELDRAVPGTLATGAAFAAVHCAAYGFVALLVLRSMAWRAPTLLRTVTVFLLAGLAGATLAAVGGAWVIHAGGMLPRPDAKAIMVPWMIGDYAGLLALGALLVDVLRRVGRWAGITEGGVDFAFGVLPSPPSRRRLFAAKLATLLLLTLLVLAAAWAIPGYPPVVFAIFSAAIVQLWIVHTEGARAALWSLAAFSFTCVLGAAAFGLLDAALTLQFAVIVVAASTCFGLAVPVLYADNARLRELLIHDPLTGAYSRAFFEELVTEQIARATALSRAATLLMIDVDGLKQVNDRHGHAAGDRMLREVVSICSGRLEPGQILGRLGGDEFCVLLPGADRTRGEARSLDMQRALAAARSTRVDGVPVGASFGLAVLGPDGGDYATLLARADAAMYAAKRAKRAGRAAIEAAAT